MNHTFSTAKKIGVYLLHQRTRLISVILLTVASAGLTLAGPYLLGVAMDDYIIAKNFDGLLQLCLLMLGVYSAGSLVGWLQAVLLADVSQRTVWRLRKDLFIHFQKLPIPFFSSKNHGELMSRTTNDIDNVTNTLNQSLIQMISSVIMLVGSFVMMLILNVWLTLVALVVIPLIVFVTKRIAKVTQRQFKGQQQELGSLNSFIEETVSGQKVITLFHQEARMAEQFGTANAKLKKVGIKAQIFSGTMGPFMNMFSHISYLIIAGAGGWLAVHELATVGVIISFLGYSRQFSGPLNEVANQYNLIQSGVAGAERVFEIMEIPSEYDETKSMNRIEAVAGKVEFRNVHFEYSEGTAALRNISFTAKPGETIALVGPTGAGKTTIINLIGRFYEIKDGQILIDDVDIRDMDKNSLRSQLGIVLQDAHLFSGTIRENIRYGKLDAGDEEVEAAAKQANAHAFISKLPLGYDTELTAEGGNISHGQRQLITIARAILSEPALLILDEATSSVDTLAELQIQEAMKKLLQGRTSFVIAHRLSTIRNADMILVIEDGEIAERGTHEELLARKGLYYKLHGHLILQEVM
ncbi:ABC transporter ATP-binding protein [Paenibacillus prosopidis]|uniref:ATP-binding cassette subfamily B protein n=1 Tax=Paenibacillus prosopidis TaxID=630520 RepID=A0A368W482_9BACL|nr:ABC transporter ATP-binding protein [Paenibacillus prosopidis]RCW48961.1 ATP-binding cassette subfamily B protein [Paenibacillus prosopidis]